MMLDLIGRLRGASLAKEVANALIHAPREGIHRQRTDGDAIGEARPSLSRRIVALMEDNLDFPLSPKSLARHLGISVRALERCCLRQFNQTPNQLYLRSRLQAARNLLFYEEREIKDVAYLVRKPMVPLAGIEPATSGSTIRRSNHLSYNGTFA
jgi:transcriptional regulator GlxA family with amidase domain